MTMDPLTNDQPGLFITGTGTEVGKTYVTAIIARSLAASGYRVGVYKPAASGCRASAAGLVSDDAVTLWEAADCPGDLARVCPQCFAAPLAPHLAARGEGRQIDADLLRRGLDYWRERSQVVLVEGAGGLLSPIGDNEYVADLAADFGYPLVVVTPNALGTINQTLSALTVAATFRGGLHLAGIVLNQTSARPDASADTNLQELTSRSSRPVLGQVRWQAADVDRGVDWYALATGHLYCIGESGAGAAAVGS